MHALKTSLEIRKLYSEQARHRPPGSSVLPTSLRNQSRLFTDISMEDINTFASKDPQTGARLSEYRTLKSPKARNLQEDFDPHARRSARPSKASLVIVAFLIAAVVQVVVLIVQK